MRCKKRNPPEVLRHGGVVGLLLEARTADVLMADLRAPNQKRNFLLIDYFLRDFNFPEVRAGDVSVVDLITPGEIFSFLPEQNLWWNLHLAVHRTPDVPVVDPIAPFQMRFVGLHDNWLVIVAVFVDPHRNDRNEDNDNQKKYLVHSRVSLGNLV